MRTKTQLELLRKLRLRQGLAKGFTLVELMIVVAIIGILSAVAIPQFLGARASAQAGARVSEQVGLAKECATFLASNGLGTNPNTSNCTLNSGGNYTATWTPTVSGLNCLGTTSATGVGRVTVTVSNVGGMTCALTAS